MSGKEHEQIEVMVALERRNTVEQRACVVVIWRCRGVVGHFRLTAQSSMEGFGRDPIARAFRKYLDRANRRCLLLDTRRNERNGLEAPPRRSVA